LIVAHRIYVWKEQQADARAAGATVSYRKAATLAEHTAAVTTLVLSSRNLSSAILFSASLDGNVRVWNLMGGCALCTLASHAGAVNALALCSTETSLYSASEDGTVRLWEASKGFTPLEW